MWEGIALGAVVGGAQSNNPFVPSGGVDLKASSCAYNFHVRYVVEASNFNRYSHFISARKLQ